MHEPTYRIEKDSLGAICVPENALYGAQTQRAIENFPVSGVRLPPDFIQAVAMIKKAAAEVNAELGLLPSTLAKAIVNAADRLLAGEYAEQFPVDVFQTGSGTSTNMNLNEVLATLASEHGEAVNPNDHVNMGQSSNDVIPTAIHLSAAIAIDNQLMPALEHLASVIEQKAQSLESICKTGRTHLMDAMPIRMGQELAAWSTQVRKGIERIDSGRVHLYQLAQGGTAVGTGINTPPAFGAQMAARLARYTGLPFVSNPCFFEGLSCQDTAVALSGQLKVMAVSLIKIANDLRWMNSGPLTGLGEIELTPLQPGSSIMPGKVNPVIPEAVAMAATQVIGNDATITLAGQSGNFQLNVMLPLIAFNLLQSIQLLSASARLLADKAIAGFSVNESRLQASLARNPILATALNPVIGYAKAAKIAQRAYRERRSVIDVAEMETTLSRSELERMLDPVGLTGGGIIKPEKKG